MAETMSSGDEPRLEKSKTGWAMLVARRTRVLFGWVAARSQDDEKSAQV